MRSPGALSSHTTFPVFLSTAMIAGARGLGMFTWLSSWPLLVPTKSRSPQDTGEEFDMLCGETPSSSIMSSFQTMSPSVWPVSFSSL